ncbi:acyl-CoA dehydrogenase family protein [Prauserella muralis]|uniref:Acyl-CoA dehydrogenase n=1 Tax=Prauserella muralis TaxID=588067 RepID=A0A2V4AKL7_9PSEU|nr:acyl-CoA dehydrogenase family protein [Prauserella muralis]PXY20815.1 acyl-CoA dehydrogenase [Prauserella muralis]TWE29844.1 alkylation response protein AidB-like acyl-CoA dehydrogenase [Prauserella muralis]
MDPTTSDEARALREAVRALLARHSDPRTAAEAPHGYDDKLWSLLCEQIGVAGLAIPERHGGAGATLAEVCVVLHELGRTLTPSPLLGSAVLAATALQATGDERVCARLLPAIADGGSVAALAWSGPDGGLSPEAPAVTAEDSALDGTAHYVLDGDSADMLLVAARTPDGTGLFEVEPGAAGLRRAHTPALDPTRRLATVTFRRTPARRVGNGDATAALRLVRDLALVALAAEQTGVAERALELTVEYTAQRRQFGRPIGSFQALKHRMADAFVELEAARSAVHAALLSALADSAELPLDAAVAAVCCARAAQHVTAEMIQLHGGIAITWEHDAHLFFKRAHGGAQLFGQPDRHVAELGAAAGIE